MLDKSNLRKRMEPSDGEPFIQITLSDFDKNHLKRSKADSPKEQLKYVKLNQNIMPIKSCFFIDFELNGSTFSIASSDFISSGSKKIIIKNSLAGEITWNNGLLSFKSDKKINVKLTGKIDCASIDLQTQGDITVDAELCPREVLRLNASKVSLNKMTSMVKSVMIKANDYRQNADMVAGHTLIKADNAYIAKGKKLISPIALLQSKSFTNDGFVKSKLSAHIEAEKFQNNGDVSASNLALNTKDTLLNNGRLYGAQGIGVEAGDFFNNGRVQTRKNINITAKKLTNQKNALLQAKQIIEIKANEMDANGEIKAKLICLATDKLNLATQLDARKFDLNIGHLEIQDIDITLPQRNGEEHADKLIAGPHSLKVNKGMVIGKGAGLHLNETITVIQGKTELTGSLHSNASKLSLQDVDVSGSVNITNSQFSTADIKVHANGSLLTEYSYASSRNIESFGNLAMQSCTLKCNGIDIKSGQAQFNLTKAELEQTLSLQRQSSTLIIGTSFTANGIRNYGELDLRQSVLAASGFDHQSGTVNCNQSTITLKEVLKQQKNSTIRLENSALRVPMLLAEGDLTANRSNIAGNCAKWCGKVDISESELTFSEQFVLFNNAYFNGKKTKLDLNLCQWLGDTTLEDSEFKAKRSAGKGEIHIKRSRVEVDDEFRTSRGSSLVFENTDFQTENTTFSGSIRIDESEITTQTYQQIAEAQYKRSKIAVKSNLNLGQDATLSFSQGEIHCGGDIVAETNVNLSDAMLNTNNYWQDLGKFNAEKIQAVINEGLYIDEQASATLNETKLNAKRLNALGDLEAENSELNTETTAFYKKAKLQKSILVANDQVLAGPQSELELVNNSTLNANNAELQGRASFEHSSIMKIAEQMNIRTHANLQVGSQSAVSSQRLENFGGATFNQSMLSVDRLELAKSLKLLEGSIANVKSLDGFFGSNIQITESNYKGELARIDGEMNIQKTKVEFEGDVTTLQNSHVTLDEVEFLATNWKHEGILTAKEESKLQIAENIESVTGSIINGKQINIAAKKFTHKGNISDLEKTNIEVIDFDVIGKVHSKNLTISADNSLFIEGQVSGENITLDGNFITSHGIIKAEKNLTTTSLVFTNYSGGLVYAPNTTISSGAYVNAGGVVSSFNLTKNVGLDLNFGLECPSLPSSWDDVCSFSKVFNVAKSAVSMVSAPLGAAMGIGNSLYHLPGQISGLVDQSRSMYNDGWDKFRLRKAIPVAMSVKNIAVSVANNASGIRDLAEKGYKYAKSEERKNVCFADVKAAIAKECTEDNWMKIRKEAVGCFMPMHNSESLFSVNAGAQASYNMNKTDLFGINAGAELGMHRVTHNSYFQVNMGVTLAPEISLSAVQFHNYGYTHASENLHFEFGDATVHDNSVFNAEGKISGKANNLTIQGEMKLTQDPAQGQSSIHIKEKMIVASSPDKVQLSGVEVKAKETVIQSQLNMQNNATLDSQETRIAKQGIMVVDKTSKHYGEQLKVEAEASYLNAGIAAKGKGEDNMHTKMTSIVIEDGATAVFTGIALSESIDNAGALLASGAEMHVDHYQEDITGKTVLTAGTKMTGDTANLKGKSLIGDGSVMKMNDTKVSGKSKVAKCSTLESKRTEALPNSNLIVDQTSNHFGKTVQVDNGALYQNSGIAAQAKSDAQGQRHFTKMESVRVEQGGKAELSGQVSTVTMHNAGEVDAKGALIAADSFNETATGRTKLSDGSRLVGKDANFAGESTTTGASAINMARAKITGKAKITNNSALNVESATVAKGGALDVDKTSLDNGSKRHIKNGRYRNKGKASKIVTNSAGVTRIENMDKVTIGKQGKADLRGELYANEMHNGGEVKAAGAKLIIDQLQTAASGKTHLTEKTTLISRTIGVEGEMKLAQESLAQSEHVNIKQNGDLSLDQSKLNVSAKLDNAGTLDANESLLQAANLQQSETGNTEIKKSTAKVDHATLAGKFAVKDNSEFAAHVTHVAKNGQFTLEDSTHTGKSTTVDGQYISHGKTIETEPGKVVTAAIIMEEGFHVTANGSGKMDSTYMKATSLDSNGKFDSKDFTAEVDNAKVSDEWRYEKGLHLKVKNGFTTTQQSHMHGEGDSKFVLEAKKEMMQGKHTGRSMHFDVEQIADANKLIQGEGQYANIQTNNLGVKTHQDVTLDKNNRGADTSLDIEAASVTVNAQLRTAGLKLKATKGNVNINASLTAKANDKGGDGNISLVAEQDVNIKGKGKAVGQRALNNSRHRGRNRGRGNNHTTAKNGSRTATTELAEFIDVNASGNVIVEAKGQANIKDASVKSAKVTSVKGRTVNIERTNKDSKTEVSGAKTLLHATNGNVKNNATVTGSEFLSVHAQNGSIVNEAFQYDEAGQYQAIRRHDAAVMKGGAGSAATGGVGTLLVADKVVENKASVIEGDGETHVYGKEGVKSTAAHSTYVNNKWNRREGFLKQTHIRGHSTKTDVYEAVIKSKQGKNVIHSDNGGIDTVGTKIIAPHGTDIVADKQINLMALKYQDREIERKNGAYGLSLSRSESNDEGAVETVVATLDGTVRVHSKNAGVNAVGARFLGTAEANLIIKGKNDVILLEEKLKHSVQTESAGLSLDAPGMKAAEGAQKGNLADGLINEDPLLRNMRETSQARNGVERSAGAWNTGVEGAAVYDQFKEGDIANGLMNRYAKVSLSYSEERSRLDYETRGPGGIQGFGHMHLESEEGKVLLGMDADVHNASVKATQFVLQATELESSFNHEKNTVTVSASPAGYGASGAHSHLKTKDKSHVNRQLNVRNNLEVNAETMELNGANINAETLSGSVKQLRINDMVDTHEAKGESYGGGTDGTVSVGMTNESSNRVRQSSGIHIREGINKEGGPQFIAEKTTITGAGNVTSDGDNNFEKSNPNIERVAINEHDRAESYNVSLNPQALADGKATQIELGLQRKDYRATLDKEGRHVQSDEDYKLRLQLPVAEQKKSAPSSPVELNHEDSKLPIADNSTAADYTAPANSNTNTETNTANNTATPAYETQHVEAPLSQDTTALPASSGSQPNTKSSGGKSAETAGKALLKDAEAGYQKKADYYDKKNQTKLQRADANKAKADAESNGEKWSNKKDAQTRSNTKQHAENQHASAAPKAKALNKINTGLKLKSKVDGFSDKEKWVDTAAETVVVDGSKYLAKKLGEGAAKQGVQTAAGAALDLGGKAVGFFGKVGGFFLNVFANADTAHAPGTGTTELNLEIQRRAKSEGKSEEVVYGDMLREQQMRQQAHHDANEARYRAAREGRNQVIEQVQQDLERAKQKEHPSIGPAPSHFK